MKRIAFVLRLLPMMLFAMPLLGQDDVIIKERRVDEQKISIFAPVNSADSFELNALRARNKYSWVVAPIIAQTWDKKVKGLGLFLRVTDQTVTPTAVVIVVDGKTTMIPVQKWEKDPEGGENTLIDREDLVRSIAAAQNVSITVFGDDPLTAIYHSENLSIFRSMVSMYDTDTFNVKPIKASQPAVIADMVGTTVKPTSQKVLDSPPSTAEPVVQAAPPTKLSRAEYLQRKVDEAAAMCREQIIATAKDPSSVQFADKYSYGFGRVISRNWIFISWSIMGRNTYGAVLRHTMTCTVSCIQGKACTWVNLEDE
jgi:hypothetical protein